ncbi:hypothetical protein MTHERMMSTA1_06890 [Methanosarcina thermophila MST-A1]|uniref:Uncharacterized protein n=1 Tax=Methanosarcina thermophila TaxID=2210 RepID=A0A3G9CT13_METTE|nr:hypothetical protein MESMT1_1462 [Methanosarcina thermophila]GLI13563.1 hypothetical protein MTHERMMSTA1_06890 [Methanosarcina thermophila MST-A1]
MENIADHSSPGHNVEYVIQEQYFSSHESYGVIYPSKKITVKKYRIYAGSYPAAKKEQRLNHYSTRNKLFLKLN